MAQYVLPEQIIAKHRDGELVIRWEPSSISEWQEAKNTGYNISIAKKQDGTYIPAHNDIVTIGNPDEFEKAYNNSGTEAASFYLTSRDVLYPALAENFMIAELVDKMDGKTESTLDSFSINMLSYFSIFDRKLSQLNGMGYSWKFPSNGIYRVTVSTSNGTTKTVEIDTDKVYKEPKINLESEFSDRTVRLSWENEDHYDTSFGFYISRSTDGLSYNKLNELPYIISKPEDLELVENSMGTTDSLPANYVDYFYKVNALDFFGDLSREQGLTKGFGFELMYYSPRIIDTEQKTDNHAYLKWDISLDDYDLLNHFSLMRADSLDGMYEVSIDSIGKGIREVEFLMEDESNFFRVESVSKYGQRLSSTPVFIMGIDSIAPLTPTFINATIDTLGRIEIKWKANKENDLWGYRVFKSNFDTDEYSLINAQPILDTMFVDSTHLDLGIENVYYVLQACDLRNNRSAFTEPIIIEKPDVIPPYPATLVSIVQQTDSVLVNWSPSASEDVVWHKLYRRALKTENKWTLIAQIDSSQQIEPLLQLDLVPGEEYAYTIIAVDDVALESEPTPLETVIMKELKEKFDPQIEVEISLDKKNKNIKLEWTCEKSEEVDRYLLYKGYSETKITRYQYIDNLEELKFIEGEFIEGKEKVFYKVCPVYGSKKICSETVDIDIAEIIKKDK